MEIDMSDRGLPYYKWFWQDWRSNRRVHRMSYIERGLYRELLDECWIEGFIPNDIKEMADICGCPEDVMANAWQVLGNCFVLSEFGWINEKIESLRTEKDKTRVARAASGRQGGLAKAAKNLANAKQNLANGSNCHIEEKRREEESREEERREEITLPKGRESESKIPPCPHQDIVDVFHKTLPELPQVMVWNKTRQGYLKARWREVAVEKGWKSQEEGVEYFQNLFRFVRQSKFLMGKTSGNGKRPFECELEWLLRPSNFVKVIEGKYHGA
jgi:uncharacterized protein YdaU (DUF1376 family)